MKAISIQQPWGTLVCSGLKDVENRSWALKSTPMRLLIHVGVRRQFSNVDDMPVVWANPVENALIMGLFGDLKTLPTSAVIGVATFERCEKENFSIWSQDGPGAEYKWVIRDAKLFKEPILNVKGKLHVFDLPEITEDNLPECVDLPTIKRDGTHLTIPLCRVIFDQLKKGEVQGIFLNLTDDNQHLFATDSLQPKETKTVTYVCGGETIEANIADFAIYPVLDEETNEPIVYHDAFEREYIWHRVIIETE